MAYAQGMLMGNAQAKGEIPITMSEQEGRSAFSARRVTMMATAPSDVDLRVVIQVAVAMVVATVLLETVLPVAAAAADLAVAHLLVGVLLAVADLQEVVEEAVLQAAADLREVVALQVVVVIISPEVIGIVDLRI